MTGLEWLNTMPYKYQVLFLKRLTETEPAERHRNGKPNAISEYLTRDFVTFHDFMMRSFNWRLTSEGHGYWSEIAETKDPTKLK